MKYKTKDNTVFYPQIYKSLIDITKLLSPLLCSTDIEKYIKNYECFFEVYPDIEEWISFYDNNQGGVE